MSNEREGTERKRNGLKWNEMIEQTNTNDMWKEAKERTKRVVWISALALVPYKQRTSTQTLFFHRLKRVVIKRDAGTMVVTPLLWCCFCSCRYMLLLRRTPKRHASVSLLMKCTKLAHFVKNWQISFNSWHCKQSHGINLKCITCGGIARAHNECAPITSYHHRALSWENIVKYTRCYIITIGWRCVT